MYLQDDFCNDQNLLQQVTDPALWRKGFNWWDGWDKQPPRNIWEQIIQYVWQREPGIVSQMAGFEYWCNVQKPSGKFALDWHQDKDEVLQAQTGQISCPAIGTIYYCFPHQVTGGCLEVMPETWTQMPPPIPPIDDLERVRPIYNRLVIFDASRWHRVAPIVTGTRYAFLVNLWTHKPKTFQDKDFGVRKKDYA